MTQTKDHDNGPIIGARTCQTDGSYVTKKTNKKKSFYNDETLLRSNKTKKIAKTSSAEIDSQFAPSY